MDFPIRTLRHEEFPPLLAEIPDPPKQLYLRGTLPDWSTYKILTVVGSRNYSSYGKEVTRSLIAGLSGYPVLVVSGLALGIDSIAHQAALDNHVPTLSVPGSGLSDAVIYPRQHRGLARKILEAGGALLSELEPDAGTAPWVFPARNRIKAGMSHAVLIIEASEKSGTLITARLGMEYNRDVLTVPGSVFSRNSFGPHALIKDGATPVTSSRDILEALDIRTQDTPSPALDVTEEEMALLLLLESPMHRDELIRAARRPAHETSITLSMLELKGYVSESNGMMMRIINM